MVDDVDTKAERAADAARQAVKRNAKRGSNVLLPLLLVAFAVATVAILIMTDAPSQPSSTVEAPPTQR